MAHLLYVIRQRRRREAVARYRIKDLENPFEMPEKNFISRFRLSKSSTKYLIQELRPHLKTGSNGYAVELQVLNSLRIMRSGSFQNVVSDEVLIQISQPSASRFFKKFLDAVMIIEKRYIYFPTSSEDLLTNRVNFYRKFNFPNVIGAVDCTHIYITKPVEDPFTYLNRKSRYSINVQMICDSELKIIDVVARWPGSTHNSFIWKFSGARLMFSSGHISQPAFLLGDSGYPLEQWLLTPYRDPVNPPEHIFNTKHRSARNVIERCCGVLKSRFRILSDTTDMLLYSPEKCYQIVKAAAVLHNLCIKTNVALPELCNNEELSDDDDDDDDDFSRQFQDYSHSNPAMTAELIRSTIALQFQRQI